MELLRLPDADAAPHELALPDLDLRVLRYFVVLAAHRHYGRAAAALYVSQSGLSRAISSLEQLLGVALFVRGQPLRLTRSGNALLAHAALLLERQRAAVTCAREAAAPAASVAITALDTPGGAP